MLDRTWRRKIICLTLRWKIMEIEKERQKALESNLFKLNTYMASRDLQRSYIAQQTLFDKYANSVIHYNSG